LSLPSSLHSAPEIAGVRRTVGTLGREDLAALHPTLPHVVARMQRPSFDAKDSKAAAFVVRQRAGDHLTKSVPTPALSTRRFATSASTRSPSHLSRMRRRTPCRRTPGRLRTRRSRRLRSAPPPARRNPPHRRRPAQPRRGLRMRQLILPVRVRPVHPAAPREGVPNPDIERAQKRCRRRADLLHLQRNRRRPRRDELSRRSHLETRDHLIHTPFGRKRQPLGCYGLKSTSTSFSAK
jgi:hypothetical protein